MLTKLAYASAEDLHAWAGRVMARTPDFVIGEPERPYLRRWWIVPRNPCCNVYLHEIARSDDDRALHDHPWDNTSLLISGRYVEVTAKGRRTLGPGALVNRRAADAHRLEIMPGERAVSLFVTGPKVREWGFLCPQGWRHWRDFTGGAHGEVIGRGCGEG